MGTPLNILHSLQLSALFSLERKRAPRRSRGTTGLQTTPTGPATEAGAPRAFFFFFFGRPSSLFFFVFFSITLCLLLIVSAFCCFYWAVRFLFYSCFPLFSDRWVEI